MADETWRRPTFRADVRPGFAAECARKGHEMGACRKWTPEEAREQGRRGAEKRWGQPREPEAANA